MSPRLVAERTDTLAPLAELFREHGFEGASLSMISKATGLGKGSLYHFFPGGKAEMLAAVLAEIDGWFEDHVFAPLETSQAPREAIAGMFSDVDAYFRTGRRVCLVGSLALGETRDRFADALAAYFRRWIETLAQALAKCGHQQAHAELLAEEVVSDIQGAIVLSRALREPDVFTHAITRLKARALQSGRPERR